MEVNQSSPRSDNLRTSSHSQRQKQREHIQTTSTSSVTKPSMSSPNRITNLNTLLTNQSNPHNPDRHLHRSIGHQSHHHHFSNADIKSFDSSFSPTESFHHSSFDGLSSSLSSPTDTTTPTFDQAPPSIPSPYRLKSSSTQIPFHLPPISPASYFHRLSSRPIDFEHPNSPSVLRSSSSVYQSELPNIASPTAPSPIPPQPIRSFFSNSPLPAFSISAEAIQLALCRRKFVAKAEDSEKKGPIPHGHQPTSFSKENDDPPFATSTNTTRTASDLTFPHIIDGDAEADRDRTLEDLLKTTWSNFAADELACKVLNYDLKSSDRENDGNICWDLVRVLAYQDLRRWLNWVKDLFNSDHSDYENQSEMKQNLPVYEFRTKLRPSFHSRFKSDIRKKEDTNDGSTLISDSSVDAEVIMIPTIIKCDSNKQDIEIEPSSTPPRKYFHRLNTYSPQHLILFTVTIIQAASPPHLLKSRSPFPWNPPTPEVTSLTPPTPPQQIKTNITNQHPPTLKLEASLPLLDPLTQAASTQKPLSSRQTRVDESEARRVVSRSNERRNSISNELKPDVIRRSLTTPQLKPDLNELALGRSNSDSVATIKGNFTKGGKVVVRIRFDFSDCYLSVSDTGVEIKRDELPNNFDRFDRVEDSAQQTEGTGIGLALVQDIIKLHRGTLEVESDVRRGSTFTANLLLATSHLPPASLDYSPETELEKIHDRVVASNVRRCRLGHIEPISSSLMAVSPACSETSDSSCSSDSSGAMNGESDLMSTSGSTILIADDDDNMRSFVGSVLGQHYNVAEAADGLEAYRWAKAHRPDLVVSDVQMPALNGLELLKRLKTDPDTAGISVILLSARTGSERRIEGLAEGADDYLVKPFEAKELVTRIDTHLQLSKMRQRLENAVTSRTKLLRENEARFKDFHTFEAISMLSPVGIIQWDIEGRVTFANYAFRSQCKLIPTDQAGENLEEWMEQICMDDRDRMKKEFRINYKEPRTTKGEFRWNDGSWCLYELSPFYDEMKVFAGCLGSTTDVTARKESERRQLEAVEARARDAEESKRQQEAFIDMTSHEIRNPLHGIHQAADLLYTSLISIYDNFVHDNDDEDEDQIRLLSNSKMEWFKQELEENIDAVESIQLCASHQSRIADDIINVSKLSMGLLTTIKTEFNLLERVCEVLSMYLIEAESKNVKLDIQVGQGLDKPAYIVADPNRLAQVMINFLSNALRYTSTTEGRRVVTIHVELFTSCPELDPEAKRIGTLKPELADEAGTESLVYAKVGVRDTARGLSQDELANLFARFAQVNPTQDQYGGSGLGLYVSRCLIENHGGFIEVVSTKGQGSVFSFVIPAKRGLGPKPTLTVDGRSGGASSRLRGVAKRLKMQDGSEKDAEIRSAASLMSVGSMPLSSKKQSPSPDAARMRSGTDEHRGESSRPPIIRGQTSVQIFQSVKSMEPVPLATHVLVVEDNLINVKVIKRQLSLKGYSISVAMDGRQGLDILYKDDQHPSELGPIGIVLMDIQMPVMSGLDAITELRASEKTGKIKRRYPVIAVTGNARKEQTEQFLASGFDDICVKPYKIEDVQTRMEALLSKGM